MQLSKYFIVFGVILGLNSLVLARSHSTLPVYFEDNTSITISSDKPEFIIKLKSNPTTGYAWSLRGYDKKMVKPVKHFFQAPARQLMGTPGYELWTFQIRPAGFVVPQQTTIHFVYVRPWNAADQARSLVFKITTISAPSASHL